MFNGLAPELRRTLRTLARSPGFTAVAVLSLAVGIGANVAIFGAVRALILDTLPLPDVDQLVHLSWTEPRERLSISQINSSVYRDPDTGTSHRSNFTFAQYKALQRTAANVMEIAGYNFLREVSVSVEGQPPVVTGGLLVDGRYFSTLRLATAVGRPLTESDDRAGAPAVAVISHRFWIAAFGGNPSALGRTMRVNGTPVEIVGVTLAGFRGLSRGGFFSETDITLPLWMQPLVTAQWAADRGALVAADNVYWLRILGRLHSNGGALTTPSSRPLTRNQIEERLTLTFRPLLPTEARASSQPPVIRLLPAARGEPTQSSGEQPLMILLGITGIVLLIACVNIAGLLLARGVARLREIAVRRAVGASRHRLIRDLLLESIVLTCAGAVAGVLFAIWGRDTLASMLTSGLGASAFGAVRLEMPIDWRLVASATAFAAVAAILCGVLPALRLSGIDAGSTLKQRAMGALPTLTIGRVLLASQVAVSVPLLVGALVFLRTLGNLASVDLGFDPRGIAFFKLNPGYAGAAPAGHAQLYLDALRRIESVPGVISATLLENALITGIASNNRVFVDGREYNMLMNAVGPRFVETMGMHVMAGRAPDASDREGRPNVAAVNEAAVAQIFGGRSPLGQTVRVGKRDVQIVGVVNNTRYTGPRSDVRPILFDAALQRRGFGGHHVVLRGSVPIATIDQAVRRAVAGVHPDLPVPGLRGQAAQIDLANARERVFARLLTTFGAFALLLAGIGLHGVTAYAVVRRTNEIGVRVAVGATPAHVICLIVRSVAVVAVAGLVVGIAAALALGPLVRSLLFGVTPGDPFLIGSAATLMAAVALGAASIPAFRAARIDAAEAVRSE